MPNKPTQPSLSAEVLGQWPHAVHVTLLEDEKSLFGQCKFTSYTDGSQRIEVCVGAHGGMAPSVLSHEASHAASRIMSHPDWRDFFPQWLCKYQKDESRSFVVERVVYTGIALAKENNILLVNPYRKVAGLAV